MKLTIEQSLENNEIEITIKCGVMDDRLRKLIESIRQYSFSLQCKNDSEVYSIPLEEIYYIETIDKKTFVYCKSEVYETNSPLNDLEEKFSTSNFIRVNKSCVLNLSYLSKVNPLWNHRLEAILKNNEKIVITRHYIPDFKNKIGL